MKTFSTIILFISVKFLAAQTDPLPLPLEGTWQMYWTTFVQPFSHGLYSQRLADTVSINDTLYYEVLTFSFCGDAIEPQVESYIRDDMGKWYVRQSLLEPEQLYFDFTLEVGDSIALSTCWGILPQPQILWVTNIEEIIMYDGSTRRMWTLAYDENADIPFLGNTEYWIEGIGHRYIGLIHPLSFSCLDLTTSLHCFLDNGDRKFPSEEFQAGIDCCTPVGIKENEDPVLSLYPNPAQTHITVNSKSTILEIEILSLPGKGILHFYPNTANAAVDIEGLAVGCYICKIKMSNGEVFMRVVSKE
jgi:hypothetical protein